MQRAVWLVSLVSDHRAPRVLLCFLSARKGSLVRVESSENTLTPLGLPRLLFWTPRSANYRVGRSLTVIKRALRKSILSEIGMMELRARKFLLNFTTERDSRERNSRAAAPTVIVLLRYSATWIIVRIYFQLRTRRWLFADRRINHGACCLRFSALIFLYELMKFSVFTRYKCH